jgi:hypothetical protein
MPLSEGFFPKSFLANAIVKLWQVIYTGDRGRFGRSLAGLAYHHRSSRSRQKRFVSDRNSSTKNTTVHETSSSIIKNGLYLMVYIKTSDPYYENSLLRSSRHAIVYFLEQARKSKKRQCLHVVDGPERPRKEDKPTIHNIGCRSPW